MFRKIRLAIHAIQKLRSDEDSPQKCIDEYLTGYQEEFFPEFIPVNLSQPLLRRLAVLTRSETSDQARRLDELCSELDHEVIDQCEKIL